MSSSPEHAPLVQSKSAEVALKLALIGLVAIVLGNAIEFKLWKIDFGQNLAGIGALVLIIGVLQWFFDRHVRSTFFAEIREEILGSSHAANSGICDFFANSRSVDFSEYFTTSSSLMIGVNYSGKLIDNCIDLLRERTAKELQTTIVAVRPGSHAETFLAQDYATADIPAGLRKIQELVEHIDPPRQYISVVHVATVLRYSFVRFDSRIWVVIGTNGLGRRAVPGFFVSSGTPWFNHFVQDIDLLLERQ